MNEAEKETMVQERMRTAFQGITDGYAILQLAVTEDGQEKAFLSLKEMKRCGKEPDLSHYEVVYQKEDPESTQKATGDYLEALFQEFNLNHPDDFAGHSLSVGDIVVLKQQNQLSFHFCDSIGFAKIDEIQLSENVLKHVEMQLEDDYGMIDGIINNGKADRAKETGGTISYYVAECMEFPQLGAYYDGLTLDEAIKRYRDIPAERMHGIKGIGFDLQDESIYSGTFPVLEGNRIDLESVQSIEHYAESPLVQKTLRELVHALPETTVRGCLKPLREETRSEGNQKPSVLDSLYQDVRPKRQKSGRNRSQELER